MKKEKKKRGCLGCLVYVLAFIGLCVVLVIGLAAVGTKKYSTRKSEKSDYTNVVKTTEKSAEEQPDASEETGESEESGTSEEMEQQVSGIRPEIKDAIDEYERFFDEYATFMEKYNNSDDVTSMLMDYAAYLLKFEEYEKKMDALENEDLTDEEALYFAEVSLRIESRLLSAIGQM